MKLRIRGNSIRLRLTKSEVGRFGQTGVVADTVEFGAASRGFCYKLHTSSADNSTRASFEGNCLSISVPVGDAENWIRSEDVGIEVMQPIGDDKFLRILMEKDFACLTPRKNEDDSDAFTNPLSKTNSM